MGTMWVQDVDWGPIDYLIVDAPPGTSDEHISIAQYLKATQVDGAVVVTTPQEVAIIDVRKEINFCKKVRIRLSDPAKPFDWNGCDSRCSGSCFCGVVTVLAEVVMTICVEYTPFLSAEIVTLMLCFRSHDIQFPLHLICEHEAESERGERGDMGRVGIMLESN
jgi:hypothetical protein